MREVKHPLPVFETTPDTFFADQILPKIILQEIRMSQHIILIYFP